LLVWNERGKAAQVINIDEAESGAVTYDSAAKLSLIKAPPMYTIDFQYGYDSAFHGSNVFKRMFQFREQYIYLDSLKSAFGETSDIAFNGDVFSLEDNVVQEENTQNFIDIKFNSGDATVEKIVLAARNGNNSDWYEIAVIDKSNPENVVASGDKGYGPASFVSSISDDTIYYYRFFNTGGYRFIPSKEINRASEFIPITSDSMKALGNNRLAFGQNVVDYADVDLGSLTVAPSYSALPGSADVLGTLKRGRYYDVAMRVMDEYGRGTEPQIGENLKVYVEDWYETANDGVASLTVSNIDTVSFPSWGQYYQFLISGSQSPFIQVPILYAMKYTDLDGEQDGSIALLVGFDVDALNDVIDNRISQLESELSDTKQKIKKWEQHEKSALGGLVEDIFMGGRDQREKNEKRDHLGDLRTRKAELENDIRLKKQELGNSYKKALANLKQYEIDKNDRLRIVKKDFTTGTDVDQVLDIQILDVVNDNSRYNPALGSYDSIGGLWLKINPPGIDGYTLDDVEKVGGSTWTQATSNAGFSDRRGHGAVKDSNGNLYVIGGTNGTSWFNDVWKSTDGGSTWTSVLTDGNAQLQQKAWFGITIDKDDVVYITGGELSDGNVVSATHYSDPGDLSVWTEASSTTSVERKDLALVINSTGRLFAIGGDAGSNPENEVYYSDDKGATWTQATNSPAWGYRAKHSCIIDSQDNIYLLGGTTDGTSAESGVYVASDAEASDWRLVTSSPGWEARKDFGCVIDSLDRMYVVGGSDYTVSYGDVWYSDDGGLNWEEVATTQTPDEDALSTHVDPCGVAIDTDGSIYLIGGGSSPANEVWHSEAYTSSSQWQDSLVEIYRPDYADTGDTFYEISGIYSVTDTSNKTLTPINAYLKKRSLYSGNTYKQKGPEVEAWVEDAHLTHDFKSDNYNFGRGYIKTDIEKNVEHPSLVYTNPHFEGTEINGLSRADYSNVAYLGSNDGKIHSLYRIGNTVKAVQSHKITSFYQTQRDPLGNERPLASDYGSVHPKSIVRSSKGYVYGFDLYNGLIWRDSGNGVYSISGKSVMGETRVDYKMESFFRDVASQLRAQGSQEGSNDVVSGYDDENGMVYVSFVNDNLTIDYNTVIFHEDSNRWVGFVDVKPQMYGSGQEVMLSSSGSKLWLHNSDAVDRLNLYGSAKEFILQLISNNAPSVKKVYNAMWIHADTSFDVNPITIPENDTNKREMVSRLKSGKFKVQDGVYKASLLHNMKTSSNTEKVAELYNGQRMRGYTLDFKLRSSSTDKFELFKVDVLTEPNI
jgi:hypothetical protein